jgi:hypothetical protein
MLMLGRLNMLLGDCDEGLVDMLGFSPVSIVGWIEADVALGSWAVSEAGEVMRRRGRSEKV